MKFICHWHLNLHRNLSWWRVIDVQTIHSKYKPCCCCSIHFQSDGRVASALKTIPAHRNVRIVNHMIRCVLPLVEPVCTAGENPVCGLGCSSREELFANIRFRSFRLRLFHQRYFRSHIFSWACFAYMYFIYLEGWVEDVLYYTCTDSIALVCKKFVRSFLYRVRAGCVRARSRVCVRECYFSYSASFELHCWRNVFYHWAWRSLWHVDIIGGKQF